MRTRYVRVYWNEHGSIIEIVYTAVFLVAVMDIIRSTGLVLFESWQTPAAVINLISFFLMLYAAVVLVRMYQMLHLIEAPLKTIPSSSTQAEGEDPSYLNGMVARLNPVSALVERLLRLCMFLSVLLVVKSSFTISQLFFVQEFLEQLRQWPRIWSIEFFGWASDISGENLEYSSRNLYIASESTDNVLLVLLTTAMLAFLFLIWDFVAVIMNCGMSDEGKLFSYMQIKQEKALNFVERQRPRGAAKRCLFRFGYYLFSGKFLERVILILVSVFGIVSISLGNNNLALFVWMVGVLLFGALFRSNVNIKETFLFFLRPLIEFILVSPWEAVQYMGRGVWRSCINFRDRIRGTNK